MMDVVVRGSTNSAVAMLELRETPSMLSKKSMMIDCDPDADPDLRKIGRGGALRREGRSFAFYAAA
jgi:hypothetical protein